MALDQTLRNCSCCVQASGSGCAGMPSTIKNNVIDLNVFVGITKSSLDDISTGDVSIYLNKSCLFSGIRC